MKVFIIALAMFLGIFSSQAQDYYIAESSNSVQLEVSAYGRRSILGFMNGVNIGVDVNSRWNFSFVHLVEMAPSEISPNQNQFEAIEVSYAINPKNHLKVELSAQAGFYNKDYFALHPSIQIKYAPESNYFMALGAGRSDGFPLFNFKVGVVIFKK